jgi:heat shock protein 5
MGNKITPSMVSFLPDSEPIIGDAAKSQLPTNPNNTVYGAKRMIGRTFKDPKLQRDMAVWPFQVIEEPKSHRPKIRVTDREKTKEFYPEEISAKVLGYLREVAKEKTHDKSIKDAVITVPAYFTDAQRSATKEAGRIAGLNVLRIIPEPTAAAIAFGISTDEEHTVLVFDLGGGTFDISILHIDGGVYEVKSILGDDHLGGEDFDNEIVNYIAKNFNDKNGCDITTNQRAMMLIKEQAEIAKKTLSQMQSATINIEKVFNGKDINEKITRKKFEELNKKHFDKLIPIVRKAIDNAEDLDKDDITDLLLVGGSSRIPYVVDLLKKEFPSLKPCSTVHPDEAVANGAAIHAYNIIHADDEDDDDDEDNEIVLCEAAPMTRGIEVIGEKMAPIIPINTLIPCTKSRSFTTTYDGQEEVNIIIFEGEAKDTKDCHFMSQFEIHIPDGARKKKGEVTIDVSFELSIENILEVKAFIDGKEMGDGAVIRTSDPYAPGEPIRKKMIKGTNKVDLLFCIDATGSMGDWLNAAVARSQDIAATARKEHPEVEFRFGAIFYRDPIDVSDDVNTSFDLTKDVSKLKSQMATQKPYGGGDGPEDWVGCYQIALNQISWDSGSSKAIIHIADAPAHGDEWGGHCKHQEQGRLLGPLIRAAAKKGIFFQGINIGKYPKESFDKVCEIYRAEGGKCKVSDFSSGGGVSAADFLQDVAREVLLSIATK